MIAQNERIIMIMKNNFSEIFLIQFYDGSPQKAKTLVRNGNLTTFPLAVVMLALWIRSMLIQIDRKK